MAVRLLRHPAARLLLHLALAVWASCTLATPSHGRPGQGGGVVRLTGACWRPLAARSAVPPPPRRLWPNGPQCMLLTAARCLRADLNFDSTVANGKPWMVTLNAHYVSSCCTHSGKQAGCAPLLLGPHLQPHGWHTPLQPAVHPPCLRVCALWLPHAVPADTGA